MSGFGSGRGWRRSFAPAADLDHRFCRTIEIIKNDLGPFGTVTVNHSASARVIASPCFRSCLLGDLPGSGK